MGTPSQDRANSENAKKSTGPRTVVGKARSSMNAVTHGGYATSVYPIERGELKEDPVEVADFAAGIVAALDPQDPLEFAQAQRIALYFLRQMRLHRLEGQLLQGAFSVEDLYAAVGVIGVGDARAGRGLEEALVSYERLREQRDL